MKQLFATPTIILILISIMTLSNTTKAYAQTLDFSKVKNYERQLDDVMEIIDTVQLKIKLSEVESNYEKEQNEINAVRLGIIYHETALNLSFLSKTEFKGYAQRSVDILTPLYNSINTSKELLPFISSYRASSLALVGAETGKLNFLNEAFLAFEEAIENYADISPMPYFLRASVSENLPWFFFKKRTFAKPDLQFIIDKQEKNKDYATWKVMSFTYWAWANQKQSRKYRTQALAYLEKAILLDPNYQAGRKRAEELKNKLSK